MTSAMADNITCHYPVARIHASFPAVPFGPDVQNRQSESRRYPTALPRRGMLNRRYAHHDVMLAS
jgi:hypothetical protein